MQIRALKTEIKKACCNRMATAAVIMVLALMLYHAVTVIINFNLFYSYYESKTEIENLMITSESVFCHWLGADVASFPTSAFYFLLPIFAVLPYGWSLASEMSSGYTKNVLSRTPRKTYLFAKYIASFISGAFIVFIPLALSLLILALFLPSMAMENIYPYGTIGQGCMWAEIYYEHPYVYCIMYILLDSVYGGLIATISTTASFFIKNKVAVVLIPFFILLLVDYIDANFLMNGEYSLIKFLQALPVANDCYGWAVGLIAVAIFAGTFGVLLYERKHYEVL
ncbi:hypothetical protein C806_00435 [Lachnospiraceae bacterium 3-1]|nr:hypothetical protein C806_00435 [Lachnospiraceae bacterium 3-1]